MSSELQPITQEHAAVLVRQSLGFLSSEPSEATAGPALCAEALRSSLWVIWSSDSRPVYVTRLINAAARTLLPWQKTDEEGASDIDKQLRATLEELDSIGDLAALPGGRWSPTPPRAVALPLIQRHLLLGGPPTRLLPADLRPRIERAGVSRLVSLGSAPLPREINALSEQEWLRAPEGDLVAWTSTVIQTAQLGRAGDLAVEFYVPLQARSGVDQFHRWRQNARQLPDGRYLARSRMRRGTNAHYIAQVSDGSLAAVGDPPLGDGDIRRLMYGLDSLAENPVRMLAERRRDQWHLKLSSELPRAERRLFLTIGRERTPADGSYYPRWWEIPIQYDHKAISALMALGVEIDPK